MKGVDELMAEHVVGFAESHREGQHHAALAVLGDAADAVAEEAWDDVGLREVRVARVQHDRLALAERVIEAA